MFRYFLVNYVQASFSADDDAVNAAFFDGCSDFHSFTNYECLFCCVYFFSFLLFANCILPIAYLYLNVILPFVKSYGDISSLTLSPGRSLM